MLFIADVITQVGSSKIVYNQIKFVFILEGSMQVYQKWVIQLA